MNKKQKEAARKAMEEWDYNDKLREAGFNDIEGGVEGPLMRGGPSSIGLYSLANRSRLDHGLKSGAVPRDFDEVADQDNPELSFPKGLKARYYHHAELIAAQALREGRLDREICFVWSLHAQAIGERTICGMLDMPRSRVRKHLRLLRKNIIERLDKEAEDC